MRSFISPNPARPRNALRPGLRVVFQHNYAAYYEIKANEILVVRILHGARDTAVLSQDEANPRHA